MSEQEQQQSPGAPRFRSRWGKPGGPLAKGRDDDHRGLGSRRTTAGPRRRWKREGLGEQCLLELPVAIGLPNDRARLTRGHLKALRGLFHAARRRVAIITGRGASWNRPPPVRRGGESDESKRHHSDERSVRRGCRARRRPPLGRSRRAEPAAGRRSRNSRPGRARGRALRRGPLPPPAERRPQATSGATSHGRHGERVGHGLEQASAAASGMRAEIATVRTSNIQSPF